MLTSIKYRSLIFFTIAAIAFGCKSSSTGPTVEQPASNTPGTFGYSLNGVSFDSKNYPAGQATTSAWVIRSLSGSKTLEIKTQISDGHSPIQFVGVEVFIKAILHLPDTLSFAIASNNGYGGVWITDSVYYASINNGTVILTKFDSVNNVVSGSFNFDAKLQTHSGPLDSVHISSGYFSNVPINVGNYGQGTITASINGQPFSTTKTSIIGYISATTTLTDPHVQIIAYDQDMHGGESVLGFTILNPKLGDYDLSTTINPGISAFVIPDSSSRSIYSGLSGTFTLTKFDTLSHRLSATFDFSGLDSTAGKTIHVTNGVIDNVRWVVQ